MRLMPTRTHLTHRCTFGAIIMAAVLLLFSQPSETSALAASARRASNPMMVTIEAHSGEFLRAPTFNYDLQFGDVVADAESGVEFELTDVDASVLHDGDTITLRGHDCLGGCHPFWYFIDSYDEAQTLTLHGSTGLNTSAELRYIVNDLDCSDCDISSGDAVVFRSSDGTRYWSADGGGGGNVHVTATDWGPYETFRLWF